jgi:hypothetical protein
VNCPNCNEPVTAEERGSDRIPAHLRIYHYECTIRMVMGSVAHQRRECSCFGGVGEDDPVVRVNLERTNDD